MKNSLKLFGLASALLLGACGQSDNLEVGSEIKITNGIEIPAESYPSVVLLYDPEASSICTGTFVTEEIVLTAAHCSMGGNVDASGNVDLTMYIIEINDPATNDAKIVGQSTKIVRDPLWDRNGKNVNRYDLGLVFFEKGVSKAVSKIASSGAQAGDDFVIVGFGLNGNDQSTAGIKRYGANTVSSVSGGFIQFTGQNGPTNGDGTNSAAGSGDSGGPLFIDGSVAGVTSGGGFGGFGRTRSLYIDLHSATAKNFLQQYLRY